MCCFVVLKVFGNVEDFPFRFEVDELKLILLEALKNDSEPCTITREKHDAGKEYSGELPLKNVPLFPAMVFAMLTGMRKGELLGTMWNNINFNNGIINISAQKTGRIRQLPLCTKALGKISPTLFELLKVWDKMTTEEYVLPHPKSDKPSELKKSIEIFRKDINISELNFQNFRKNFISYAASFNIPPTIVAFWAGHSTAVAEKNYLSYAIGRKKGKTVEETMGIDKLLKQAIEGYKSKGKFKNLSLTNWN